MDLHEFAPVSGRATSGRHRRRFERFAEVCQDLPDLSRVGDEGDEPDVTATRWARKRKLLPHPGHQFRPGNSRGVVRAGLCMSVAAAFHGKRVAHARDAAARVADHGEPLERKGRTGRNAGGPSGPCDPGRKTPSVTATCRWAWRLSAEPKRCRNEARCDSNTRPRDYEDESDLGLSRGKTERFPVSPVQACGFQQSRTKLKPSRHRLRIVSLCPLWG